MKQKERAQSNSRRSLQGSQAESINSDAEKPLDESAVEESAEKTVVKSEPTPLKLNFVRNDGPRFWALPDAKLGWWVIRENDYGIAGLTVGKPVILVPNVSTEDKQNAAERCRALVSSRLTDVFHDDLFNLIKRMMLGGVLIFAGLFGLRLPGGLEFVDMTVLLGALAYTGYAGLRYGYRVLSSLEAANRPFSQFAGEPFVENKLADRLARALQYRFETEPAKRGESPDDELLDTNAYRKLIEEGVTTRRELSELGAAIDARFGLVGNARKPLSEIVREEGIDAESAALYRDLANAARELAMEPDIK